MPKIPNIEQPQNINIYEEIEKKAKKAKDTKDTSTVTVRFSSEDLDLIRRQAEKEYYPVSSFIRKAVMEYIKQQG